MTAPAPLADRLRDLSVDQLSVAPASLQPTTTLRDDLGLDSLAAIEWGMAIEDAFGIALPDDAMEQVKTYGDVEALVGRLVAPSA